MASLTILIIDDDHRAHRTARMAAYLLAEQQDAEVRVLTATSAVEGAELLRSPEPIDLVLLDIHLPGHIDGRLASGLISELRPGVPILPFTADRTEQTAAHLRSIGLAPPVFKPIDPEPLAEHIARALERPAGEASPLQGFLADQARLVADLTEPTAARRALRVAVLAREHLALLGLTTLLHEIGHARPLQIELATSRPEELGTLVRGGGPDLLVSAADVGEAAEPLVRSHGIPPAHLCDTRAGSAGSGELIQRCGRPGQQRRARSGDRRSPRRRALSCRSHRAGASSDTAPG